MYFFFFLFRTLELYYLASEILKVKELVGPWTRKAYGKALLTYTLHSIQD